LGHLVYGLSATKRKGTGFRVHLDPDAYVRTSRKKKISDRDGLRDGVADTEDICSTYRTIGEPASPEALTVRIRSAVTACSPEKRPCKISG